MIGKELGGLNMDHISNRGTTNMTDFGPFPLAINIDRATKANRNYRFALWTGEHLQVTLMSIRVGGDIGLEMHPHLDQFIRVESGQGFVKMGDSQNNLTYRQNINSDYAVIVPAGTWHNIVNVGNVPLKLYSIYAPPQHPFGTIQETKEIAEMSEEHYLN